MSPRGKPADFHIHHAALSFYMDGGGGHFDTQGPTHWRRWQLTSLLAGVSVGAATLIPSRKYLTTETWQEAPGFKGNDAAF